ncbi:MAG: IPExxxVDY family protein [Bacteroidales bacterium]|nr:IPExxxVDY family protein [Bacteroidales bacterium]
MKTKIINLNEDAEFNLLGISSKLSMHKISWLLNQQLDFNFHRFDEHGESNLDKEFSVYQYEDDTAIYNLIENKSKDGLLLKKLNTIDYLLKIEGELTKLDFEQLQKKIRQIPEVYACLNIDISVLKKKELDLLF